MNGAIPMTPEDYRFIRQLREARALDDFRPERIRSQDGDCVIGVFCSDGHRFNDKYGFLHDCGCEKHIHVITRNGGSLVLPEQSPLATKQRGGLVIHKDMDLLDEIEESCRIKRTGTIISFAHLACAKARSAGLDASEVTRLHIAAKDRLREELPGRRISCLIHVDYIGHDRCEHERRFATYFLNRNNLAAWSRAVGHREHPALAELLQAA